MTPLEWLGDLDCYSLSLSLDDCAKCNGVTAKVWIEDYVPEQYGDVPADALQLMKDTDTIWALQIYPDTGVGFYEWRGPTMAYVLDAAMRDMVPHG